VSQRARPVALAIFRRGQEILLIDITVPSSGRRFYRPPGGGIEYGERAADAVLREAHEELSTPCSIVRFLGVLENIFHAEEGLGHELMMLYELRFDDDGTYGLEEVPLIEDNGDVFTCRWRTFEAARQEGRPVYPDGLDELLTKRSV
jgi:ADP-ribose pyrophosphatase YjhB (NUDIX family)